MERAVIMISVIIPVYNVESYLTKCLESIVNQSSFFDYEVLLIDDGSSDGSGSICDTFCKNNPEKIRVFHKTNGGLSDARNFGLQRCRGDFVCFIDSDDFVSSDFLLNLSVAQSETGADIVVGFAYDVDSRSRIIKEPNLPSEVFLCSGIEASRLLNKGAYSYLMTAWGKLFKANLFVNKKFPFGLYHEDEAVAQTIYLKADKVFFSTNVNYYYMQRAGSITGLKCNKRDLDYLETILIRGNDACDMEFFEFVDINMDQFLSNFLRIKNKELNLSERKRMNDLYLDFRSLYKRRKKYGKLSGSLKQIIALLIFNKSVNICSLLVKR